jgi:hypothetical protein
MCIYRVTRETWQEARARSSASNPRAHGATGARRP